MKLAAGLETRGTRALDVSCRNGEVMRALAACGFEVRGTRFERGLPPIEGMPIDEGVDLTRGLPYPDKSFDLVVLTEVIEHLENHRAALGEVARVLRPGGQFVTSVVGDGFARNLLGTKLLDTIGLDGSRYGRWFNKLSYHFNTLSAQEWRARFEAAGLEVVYQRPYFSFAALKLFDFSHYYGAPALLTRRLTGRWLLYPPVTPNLLWEPLLRRIYEAAPGEDGPYYFFVCRKP